MLLHWVPTTFSISHISSFVFVNCIMKLLSFFLFFVVVVVVFHCTSCTYPVIIIMCTHFQPAVTRSFLVLSLELVYVAARVA